MFWYVVLGVLAFVVLFPYVRCLFKRLVCFYKIKCICRNKDYKMYAAHPVWCLGGKHSEKCDFYIETENEMLAVKLFGMPKYRSVLVLLKDGRYFVRRFFALFYLNFPIESKPKKLPEYNFEYEFRGIDKEKELTKILLINPVAMEFRYRSSVEDETVFGDGDRINGIIICSLPRLLLRLEKGI